MSEYNSLESSCMGVAVRNSAARFEKESGETKSETSRYREVVTLFVPERRARAWWASSTITKSQSTSATYLAHLGDVIQTLETIALSTSRNGFPDSPRDFSM